MGKLVNEITGMTDGEIREADDPRVHSKDQLHNCGLHTRNVRVNAGLTVTSDDLDKERADLAERQKKYSRKNEHR